MAALWIYVVSETVEKKLEVSEDDEDDGGRLVGWGRKVDSGRFCRGDSIGRYLYSYYDLYVLDDI